MNRSTLYFATGTLTVLSLGLCFYAWFMNLNGPLGRYDFFPLLGLLAFCLMWMHYVSGTLKRYLNLNQTDLLGRYFKVTSVMVLALILIHPALLYTGLWQDGFGLPLGSGLAAYPATAAKVGLLLGSSSLAAFLLFETKRWFGERTWWKYIEYASIGAMILIFIHALILGGELMSGWFRVVWITLGVTFVLSLIYNYWYDRRRATHAV